MSRKIAEIKALLAEMKDESDPRLTEILTDERKGVQQAVNTFQKRINAQKRLAQLFEEKNIYEKNARANGAKFIAGIDEVGRGPLAGPVVASAVILDEKSQILGLNDSKQLSEKKREELFAEIQEKALAIGIGIVSPEVIDTINILEATKLAMKQAIEKLTISPDFLLIDALTLDLPIEQEKIIKGDMKSNSIAAASIVAKVTRDNMMKEYAKKYPYYAFENNAGYGTKAHLEGIREHGITPIHRKSFEPIKSFV
ncbi:RNase HII [Pilibacter termitis]|uniref:Ribonuclease HII n=1 Tax=Pilibacter termitis TaxID=263852 RepID=A0A1T4Q8S3_9ENTE|nr:ribonuclease HII [Pilibacter termitis]SKA00200.1 RNase HII [Pilibacter termitis]